MEDDGEVPYFFSVQRYGPIPVPSDGAYSPPPDFVWREYILEIMNVHHWFAVRWLVARGRNSEARALIQRAAKRNRVTIPDQLIHDMEKTIQLELCLETHDKNYTALDLFRSMCYIYTN